MKILHLYTTSGCHLCEEAEKLLNKLQASERIQWQPVEISDSDELIDRYGVRIPVVKEQGSQREIGWPFSLEELRCWVRKGFISN